MPGSCRNSKGGYDYNIESTRTYHWPVIRAFRGVAHAVNPLLANPTRRKTDVLRAKLLARQALLGTWKASFVPSDAAVEVRTLLMRRHDAMWRAKRATGQMRDLVQRLGHTFPSHTGSPDGKATLGNNGRPGGGPHSDDVRGLLRASCTTRSVSSRYARICEGFMAGRTAAPKWDTRRHKDG